MDSCLQWGKRHFTQAGSAQQVLLEGEKPSPGSLSYLPLCFLLPACACTNFSLGQEFDCCNPKNDFLALSSVELQATTERVFVFPFPCFQKGPAETQVYLFLETLT